MDTVRSRDTVSDTCFKQAFRVPHAQTEIAGRTSRTTQYIFKFAERILYKLVLWRPKGPPFRCVPHKHLLSKQARDICKWFLRAIDTPPVHINPVMFLRLNKMMFILDIIAITEDRWAIRWNFPIPWTLHEINFRSTLGRADFCWNAVHLKHTWYFGN